MDGHAAHNHREPGNYNRLVAMTALSFIAMYLLMYAMVFAARDVFMNLNQAYMAGLMAAPMVLIELAVMRSMYPRRRLNLTIGLATIGAPAVFFLFLRQQTAIGDRQFLRSMIPHHSGAILMCNRASISSPAIQSLCQTIITSQQAEIDLMKSLLREPAP